MDNRHDTSAYLRSVFDLDVLTGGPHTNPFWWPVHMRILRVALPLGCVSARSVSCDASSPIAVVVHSALGRTQPSSGGNASGQSPGA